MMLLLSINSMGLSALIGFLMALIPAFAIAFLVMSIYLRLSNISGADSDSETFMHSNVNIYAHEMHSKKPLKLDMVTNPKMKQESAKSSTSTSATLKYRRPDYRAASIKTKAETKEKNKFVPKPNIMSAERKAIAEAEAAAKVDPYSAKGQLKHRREN